MHPNQRKDIPVQTPRRSFPARHALLLCGALLLPSAAAAQERESTTVGGYGELHYNEPDGAKKGMLDFHRFVLYLSHRFNDRISFFSELELEHTRIEAGDPDGGELGIEQAYLDYRIASPLGVRAGILLVPVGLINLYHEPPFFNGVERPNVDRIIIPTTWREAGLGVFGDIAEGVTYQAALVAGLDASGFSAENGIRGGRQSGFESSVEDIAFTGRLDVAPTDQIQLGASFFTGGSAQGVDSIGSARVTILSADGRMAVDRLAVRGVAAYGAIADADAINRTFGGNVADSFLGYYLEAGYDVLPLLAPETDQSLSVFARYERYDTQLSTTGFDPLKQYRRTDIVLGLTYKPVYNAVVKFDYTFLRNDLDAGVYANTGQLNVGIGYVFN